MKLEEIGFYTLEDRRAANSSHTSPLWRCELILTDSCNFRCPYCRGIRDDCKGAQPMERAVDVVEGWARHGLRNIRFSGGEPTLYRGLVDLVRIAKQGGVQRIAISTNGSAPRETYDRLIDAGANDFSVSLDACCASGAQSMAGGIDAWDKVVSNIRHISSRTYCTVGVVLTDDNLADVAAIIRFAHELGVADIRIIPAAQHSNTLAGAVEGIEQEILDAHPILKYRVLNIGQERQVRGIQAGDNVRCPLVLDDMAVAGEYHFPCIIYLREGGDAIGKVGDMDRIREERKAWAETHDCQADPICARNCLDVCVDYNNRWRKFHSQETAKDEL